MIRKAIAIRDTTIVMNSIASCMNLLKTEGDPLGGPSHAGGAISLKLIEINLIRSAMRTRFLV